MIAFDSFLSQESVDRFGRRFHITQEVFTKYPWNTTVERGESEACKFSVPKADFPTISAKATSLNVREAIYF